MDISLHAAQPGWNTADTLLYRGIVESHFGQERKAIEDLTRFLAGGPSPAQRRTAYEELAAALARVGQYAAATRDVTEALRLTPEGERADGVNTQHLYAAVAGVPPQSVAFERDVPVRATFNELGSWNVPVDVNGQRGEWIFDTGANWSTLTAGEAARLGLATRGSDVTVGGSTGKQNALRLTVVPELRLGRARVRNVIFLVLSDESRTSVRSSIRFAAFSGCRCSERSGGLASRPTATFESSQSARNEERRTCSWMAGRPSWTCGMSNAGRACSWTVARTCRSFMLVPPGADGGRDRRLGRQRGAGGRRWRGDHQENGGCPDAAPVRLRPAARSVGYQPARNGTARRCTVSRGCDRR